MLFGVNIRAHINFRTKQKLEERGTKYKISQAGLKPSEVSQLFHKVQTLALHDFCQGIDRSIF